MKKKTNPLKRKAERTRKKKLIKVPKQLAHAADFHTGAGAHHSKKEYNRKKDKNKLKKESYHE